MAKFHADGLKFLRDNKAKEYKFLQADEKRSQKMTRLLDKYLEPYLSYLDQFSPVQPAVLLLKEMAKSGSLHDTVFRDMETVERQLFTVCHK